MQHQLSMAEVHPFGQASGTRGIEGGGASILGKIWKFVIRIAGHQQAFVFGGDIQGGGRSLASVIEQHQLFDWLNAITNGFQDREKLGIDQDDVVFGVIDGVENLFRAQADVDGVQDRTHHWHCEETFQITVAIPIHHRHGITVFNAKLCQAAGQTIDAFMQIAISLAFERTVNDLLIGKLTDRVGDQLLDKQRIGISGGSAFDRFFGHLISLLIMAVSDWSCVWRRE